MRNAGFPTHCMHTNSACRYERVVDASRLRRRIAEHAQHWRYILTTDISYLVEIMTFALMKSRRWVTILNIPSAMITLLDHWNFTSSSMETEGDVYLCANLSSLDLSTSVPSSQTLMNCSFGKGLCDESFSFKSRMIIKAGYHCNPSMAEKLIL